MKRRKFLSKTAILASSAFISPVLASNMAQKKIMNNAITKENRGSEMVDFSKYLRGFDYQERVDMKIKREELFVLYAQGKLQLIDIRFKEEHEAWSIGFGDHIPLNELPDRLGEIDKTKTIVTMCPHYDRAEIARLYLKLQGFDARYLTDGMLGLIEYLRGDKARDYMKKIKG